jgi:hypothetical protein
MKGCSISVAIQIDLLKALGDGWYHGDNGFEGLALDPEGLDWAVTVLSGWHPAPYIYPTLDGGLSVEWDMGSVATKAKVDLKLRTVTLDCDCMDCMMHKS